VRHWYGAAGSPASGAVRAARRPAGWRASGPAPLTPYDRRDVWPEAGEELVYLSGEWRILQRADGHRWSLDDLVTAWFAGEVSAARPPGRIADLGCGIGAVLLMLAWRYPEARCAGVEAQAESAALARRSAAWNGVTDRVAVQDGDLRQALLPAGEFDLVSGTPPYLPAGTGRRPARRQQAGCHFEERGGIEAYCAAAARLLAGDGWFTVCHASAQRQRVERAARTADLGIARRVEVVPRAGKSPLFTVYGMRHAARAQLTATELPPLIVRGTDGQWTRGFRAVRSAMGMPTGAVDG
jgi:tRNA1(Val) A37 N6-methylase TrmN6